jgi:hypothetical protein
MRSLLLNQGDQRARDREWFALDLTRGGTPAEDLRSATEPELRLIECGKCIAAPSVPQAQRCVPRRSW